MKLTHTTDNRLPGFFIRFYTECRIFFCQFSQTYTQLIKILLCLRLNGYTDNGIGEFDRFKRDRMIFVTQRVTRANILETNTGSNITATNFLHRILLIRMHLEQAGDTLFLIGTRIQHVRSGYYFARIHTEIAQATHIRIGGNLKRQRRQRFLGKRLALDLNFRIARIVSCHCGRICRTW